jgi:hypothetical protein
MSMFSFIKSSTMKSIVCASILALSLLNFPVAQMAHAQTGRPFAQGSYRFTLEDGLTKYIEFRAITNSDGSTSGEMTFSGPAEIPDQDVDGVGRAGFSGSIANISIEARFDSMVIEGNRAVMRGVITGATIGEYIGQPVLLTVEDNGDGTREPDTLTWGLYKPAAEGWIPQDAELRDDNGASLRWTATDAEREDDRGIPSDRSTAISCQSFPLSSYAFIDTSDGSGDIQVQP